jgi:hypothetical protein
MIESIPAVLESLLKARSLAGLWANWRKNSSGNAALLVEELRDNLRFCTLVLEDGVDISAALEVLSTKQYDRLLGEDPGFKSLTPRKLGRFKSLENTDLEAWQGRPTVDLVKNVYGKIKDVQVLYPRTRGSKQRRWHVRVANIRKKILLLLRNSKA